MSDDPRHRSRRRRPIQIERLETRALLSASSVSSPARFLVITPSSEYVNQQQGSFAVTLTLTQDNTPGNLFAAVGHTPAALAEPVIVDLSALGSTALEPTPDASAFFAPVNELVTFPAGATSETVNVPIISSAPTPDQVLITLSATTTSPNVHTTMAPMDIPDPSTTLPDWVALYSTPDAVPPTITSVQVVTQGTLASAVVLGFSKPMTPAAVENIHDYRILSRPDTIRHSSLTFTGVFQSETTQYQSFPIAAATYDPSTFTVTLTLKRPVKASKLSQISSAYPVKGHVLTDLAGQRLAEGVPPGTSGVFTIGVRGVVAGIDWAPGPLKSTASGTTNYLSG